MNSTQYAEDSASDMDMLDLVPTTVNTNSTQSAEDSMGDSKMLDIVSLSTKTTQMDDLPTEILLQITKHLSAKDLGSLRLASRRYGRDGRPKFLCANVNVTETRASLERLVTISSQNEEITGSVKHLQYMAFDLDGRFVDTCTPGCGKDCLPRSNRRDVAFTGYPGKCGQLWSNYEELVAERKAIATGKENSRLVLTDAFLHIRPTSITIVAPDFHKQMEMRPPPTSDLTAARESILRSFFVRVNPEYPRGLPDRNSNNYKPSPHKLYEDLKQRNLLDRSQNVRSDKEHSPVFTRSFKAVLWAVRDSGLDLKSLKASTGLPSHTDPGSICHQKALSNLVDLELDIMLSLNEFRPNQYQWDLAPRLSLNLNRGLDDILDWMGSVCTRGILEPLLQGASKLENLELAMVGRLYIAFGYGVHYLADELELLGTKRWQNLKSIKLRFFNCTDAGLFRFILRHKKTLQHVQIENIEFQCNTGTTMKAFMGNFLQQIRYEIMDGNLKLQSFRLGGCLLGGEMVPVPPAHRFVFPTQLFGPATVPLHWQDAFRVHIKEKDTQSMNDYVLGLVDIWDCGGDVDDAQLVSV